MNLFLPDLDFICATFAKDRKRFSGNVFSTGRTKYKKQLYATDFFQKEWKSKGDIQEMFGSFQHRKEKFAATLVLGSDSRGAAPQTSGKLTAIK